MWKWAPFPFLRYTPVFIGGILAAYYADLVFPLWLQSLLLLLYLCLLVFTPRRYLFYISLPAGLLGLLLIFLSGWQLLAAKQEKRDASHLVQVKQPYAYYLARVTEAPQRKNKVFRTLVSAVAVVHTDSLHQLRAYHQVKGSVVLYQPLEDSLQLMKYGNLLLIKGKPDLVKPPANPHEFDYRQYLATQNIYHQHYVRAKDWVCYRQETAWSVPALAQSFRKKSTEILLRYIPDQQAAGIALALTLGVKDYLDDVVRESYAATGAMHVLAVSGLHVGIIYLLLAFLLTPLLRIPGAGVWLRVGICIGALWFYALIAGCSPSVLRAALMFSFIITAQAIRWQSNIYNTLAASAFLLLCIDPLLVFSVGFQLSYLAVAGIVYLQPKIYRWFNSSYWLTDKIWSLTSVSMAAQLATFPLSLYYFHQFPVYFWLSNLLVIPAAFVILLLGLATIASGFVFSAAASVPGWCLSQFITVVNQGIAIIESLPASTLSGLFIDLFQTLLIYGFIASVLLLLHTKRFSFAVYTFVCALLLFLSRFYAFDTQNRQRSITFYQVNEQRNVDFTHGIYNLHWGEFNDKAKYHIAPSHIQAGLTNSLVGVSGERAEQLAIQKTGNLRLGVWHGHCIVWIEEPFAPDVVLKEKIDADILVICHNAVKNLETVLALFRPGRLVIDSSNHPGIAGRLAEEAAALGVSCHAVHQQGALTIHIPD